MSTRLRQCVETAFEQNREDVWYCAIARRLGRDGFVSLSRLISNSCPVFSSGEQSELSHCQDCGHTDCVKSRDPWLKSGKHQCVRYLKAGFWDDWYAEYREGRGVNVMVESRSWKPGTNRFDRKIFPGNFNGWSSFLVREKMFQTLREQGRLNGLKLTCLFPVVDGLTVMSPLPQQVWLVGPQTEQCGI